MTIKELFEFVFTLPESRFSYHVFIESLDVDESEDWNQLTEESKSGIILQASMLTGFRIAVITEFIQHEIRMSIIRPLKG